MQYPQSTYIFLLNMLLGAYYLTECNDALKGTSAYKHKLKNLLNQLEKELHPMIDKDLSLLWGVDDEAMYGLMDGMEQLVRQSTRLRPENMAGLAELLKQFFNAPSLILHRNGIKIIEPETKAA